MTILVFNNQIFDLNNQNFDKSSMFETEFFNQLDSSYRNKLVDVINLIILKFKKKLLKENPFTFLTVFLAGISSGATGYGRRRSFGLALVANVNDIAVAVVVDDEIVVAVADVFVFLLAVVDIRRRTLKVLVHSNTLFNNSSLS